MNWLITENKKRVNINEIPVLSIGDLRLEIIKLSKRVVGFFGKKENENIRLFVVLSDDKEGKLYISSSIFEIRFDIINRSRWNIIRIYFVIVL